MTNFNEIEYHLENIITTAYDILEVHKQDDDTIENINQLLSKRDQQLQLLKQTEINKQELTKQQKDKLQNFFTRFYLIDKRMNKFFSTLALRYQSTLDEITNHKKAKKAYKATVSTSKFLDAQIMG